MSAVVLAEWPGLTRRLALVLALVAASAIYPAHAINSSELGGLQTILHEYLLEGGTTTELALDETESGAHIVSTDAPLSAQFSAVGEDLELCFFLRSSGDLQGGGIVFEINGDSLDLVEGENCFSLPLAMQETTNVAYWQVDPPDAGLAIFSLGISHANPIQLGLPVLTRGGWDERAVRKVLKVFAFGGHALEPQIHAWANMPPGDAIREMLTFDEHNPKLSPILPGDRYDDTASAHGTLTGFQNFISSRSSFLPIPNDRRDQYGLDGYNFDDAFNRMITVRGMNPFRQRIGFWETNYHLAVNLDASVSRRQVARYYDDIMAAHAAGLPYHEVLGVAAKSAAVAMQYGHRNNRWSPWSGECECNEDFAREIHQLYYGIFGEGDPDHESETIPETAKLLTDMEVPYIQNQGFATEVDFDTDRHFPGAVTIFGQQVSGVDASAKIDNLMPLSMQHPEAKKNLPVMIIAGLADDNLDEARMEQLRAAWEALGPSKDFLAFIRGYAISEMFHSQEQFKYFTTHERALYMANKSNLENIEAYFGGAYYNGGRAGRTVGSVVEEDLAGDFFRPLHNVFGGQNSVEASDSALAFENNYNRLTDREGDMRTTVGCDDCDRGQSWEKRWEDVLPRRADGKYYVADVAAWLWMHAVGNFDNYTELERAHLYALLGAAIIDPGRYNDGDNAFDFNLLMCVILDYQVEESAIDAPVTEILTGRSWNDYCDADDGVYDQHELDALNAAYTGQDIADSPLIQGVLDELGSMTLPLNASGPGHYNNGANLRRHARERVSSALGFIFTTPFVFAEGG